MGRRINVGVPRAQRRACRRGRVAGDELAGAATLDSAAPRSARADAPQRVRFDAVVKLCIRCSGRWRRGCTGYVLPGTPKSTAHPHVQILTVTLAVSRSGGEACECNSLTTRAHSDWHSCSLRHHAYVSHTTPFLSCTARCGFNGVIQAWSHPIGPNREVDTTEGCRGTCT